MLKCKRLFVSLHQKKEGECVYLTTENENKSLQIFKESLTKAQKRSLESFINVLAQYLKESNKENRQLVETHIGYLKEDGIKFPRYMEEQAIKYLTNLVSDFQAHLTKLMAEDRDDWIKLLFSAKFLYDAAVYQNIKDCSPFHSVLVLGYRGSGWVQIRETMLEEIMSNLITERSCGEEDYGHYLLEITENDLTKAKIHHVKEI